MLICGIFDFLETKLGDRFFYGAVFCKNGGYKVLSLTVQYIT